MAEAYDNSYLPETDPAVLEFTRWCILSQILRSPQGFELAEDLARDPEEYIRSHAYALFAQLKAEYSLSHDAPCDDLAEDEEEANSIRLLSIEKNKGNDNVSEWWNVLDLADPERSGAQHEIEPKSLRLNDGDVHRLAQELRRDIPMVIALKRSNAVRLPGMRPPMLSFKNVSRLSKGSNVRSHHVAGRTSGMVSSKGHSRRYLEEMSKG